jgi:hypothetical protein
MTRTKGEQKMYVCWCADKAEDVRACGKRCKQKETMTRRMKGEQKMYVHWCADKG